MVVLYSHNGQAIEADLRVLPPLRRMPNCIMALGQQRERLVSWGGSSPSASGDYATPHIGPFGNGKVDPRSLN